MHPRAISVAPISWKDNDNDNYNDHDNDNDNDYNIKSKLGIPEPFLGPSYPGNTMNFVKYNFRLGVVNS